MKKIFALSVFLAVAPCAQGADIEAGKARAASVCAACHGANGQSVSDTIPNLAAQRAGYLEAQLSADDIANVAAYFAAQPGGTGAKSALLPNVAKTRVTFPEGYKESFVKYHTISFPATKQVRYYYANKVAAAATLLA